MTDIKCPKCGTLFARENSPGVLDMKLRDAFRRITGGVVEGPCRKCGNIVRWPAGVHRIQMGDTVGH